MALEFGRRDGRVWSDLGVVVVVGGARELASSCDTLKEKQTLVNFLWPSVSFYGDLQAFKGNVMFEE